MYAHVRLPAGRRRAEWFGALERHNRGAQGRLRRAVVGHPASWWGCLRAAGSRGRRRRGALQHTACLLVRRQRAVLLLDPLLSGCRSQRRLRQARRCRRKPRLASHSPARSPDTVCPGCRQRRPPACRIRVQSESPTVTRLVVQSLVQPQNRPLPVGPYRLRHALRTVIDIDLPPSPRHSLSFAAWHAWDAARLFPSVSLACSIAGRASPSAVWAWYHSREDIGPRRGYDVRCRLCRLHVPPPPPSVSTGWLSTTRDPLLYPRSTAATRRARGS